jgi:hypothetical protein
VATALELIVRAYKTLTVVGASSATSPTTEKRNDGLTALNALLDSWSNENLTCYQVRENSFTLSVGVSSYTIGSGGTVNVSRPLQITQAYVQDGGGNNFGLTLHTRETWNMIGNRSSVITSQIPTDAFYDPAFPLGIFAVFPYPLTAYTVFFDSYLPVATLSTLTHSISMPLGYERAMVFNLAVEISAQTGIPLPTNGTNVMKLAEDSLANIKRTNVGNREVISIYDGAIVTTPYASYNPYSDRIG